MEHIIAPSDDKSYIHCPKCDKLLIHAAVIVDGVIKCDKCHRRYLLNIQDGSVTIKLISKAKDEE